MRYHADTNTYYIVNTEYNLDRRLRRTLSVTKYDDSGNAISSNNNRSRYYPIIPGSWGEVILTCMEVLYDLETNNP